MVPLIDAAFFILGAALQIVFYLLIAYAIMTWLVSFEIINLRNRIAYQLVHALERFADTILRPVRRIVPRLGGLDFSVIVTGLLIIAFQTYLLPPFHAWLVGLVSGAA